MAEVMRSSPLVIVGQHHLADAMDVIDVSNRLMVASLQQQPDPATTIINQNEEKEKQGRDGVLRTADGGVLHIPPRRAFTTSEYLFPTAPVSRVGSPALSPRDLPVIDRDSYFQLPAYAHSKPSSPYLSPSPLSSVGGAKSLSREGEKGRSQQALRSYSVMDYEPVPFTHRPGTTLQLSHLPAELHYAIFDFLDPIDSVCLALTGRHFYAVHRKLHGRVSLAARREGPNDMEWVWRHAGPFLLSPSPNNRDRDRDGERDRESDGGAEKRNSLAMLSPRGQVYCRKCRTARCELNKHIREWMGPDLEYCLVTEKYGPPAQEGAKGFCYRSSPRHPNRCGRHTRNQRQIRLV
jgi:hypothetical protein